MSAAWALLLSAAMQLALRLTGPLVSGGDAACLYMETILRQLLLWGLPGLLLCGLPGRASLRVKPAHAAATLLAGAAAQYALSFVTERWQALTGAEPSHVPLPDDPFTWVLAILALVIVPAVTEEIFFRHGVMRALETGWSSCGALFTGAAVFALMHGSLAGLPAHLSVGLLMGVCWLGTRSLTACVLLHGAYNACALWWSLYPPAQGLLLLLLAAALLAGFAVWMLRGVSWRRGAWRGALPVLLAAGAALIVRLV